MLRAAITKSASALQRRKLIGYIRGKIDIVDRRGLEADACAYYQDIKPLSGSARA